MPLPETQDDQTRMSATQPSNIDTVRFLAAPSHMTLVVRTLSHCKPGDIARECLGRLARNLPTSEKSQQCPDKSEGFVGALANGRYLIGNFSLLRLLSRARCRFSQPLIFDDASLTDLSGQHIAWRNVLTFLFLSLQAGSCDSSHAFRKVCRKFQNSTTSRSDEVCAEEDPRAKTQSLLHQSPRSLGDTMPYEDTSARFQTR
jgi:hypothetical protein